MARPLFQFRDFSYDYLGLLLCKTIFAVRICLTYLELLLPRCCAQTRVDMNIGLIPAGRAPGQHALPAYARRDRRHRCDVAAACAAKPLPQARRLRRAGRLAAAARPPIWTRWSCRWRCWSMAGWCHRASPMDRPLDALRRLELLRELKRRHPALPIYAFGLVTRISKNRASVEEPSYWHVSGPELYSFSQQYDAQHFGGQPAPEHRPEAAHLQDMLRRRARNHLVNLATLDLLADDVFALLVISSDDTSEYGFGTREKAWLREWARRRGDDPRLLMYPGADEVGSALLARALLAARGEKARFYVHYAIPADAERIAPFEDGPVRLTLQRQIRAVGGEQVDHNQPG